MRVCVCVCVAFILLECVGVCVTFKGVVGSFICMCCVCVASSVSFKEVRSRVSVESV